MKKLKENSMQMKEGMRIISLHTGKLVQQIIMDRPERFCKQFSVSPEGVAYYVDESALVWVSPLGAAAKEILLQHGYKETDQWYSPLTRSNYPEGQKKRWEQLCSLA